MSSPRRGTLPPCIPPARWGWSAGCAARPAVPPIYEQLPSIPDIPGLSAEWNPIPAKGKCETIRGINSGRLFNLVSEICTDLISEVSWAKFPSGIVVADQIQFPWSTTGQGLRWSLIAVPKIRLAIFGSACIAKDVAELS